MGGANASPLHQPCLGAAPEALDAVDVTGLGRKDVRGVPHAEVQRYYSIVDVLAYPRHLMRLTETVTPLKPLEAMAQGRLVVASDVGGHRELIQNGQTGVLFKAGSAEQLASAIIDLVSHPERWATVRDRARRFVEQERNWAGSVALYRPIMERLLRRAA